MAMIIVNIPDDEYNYFMSNDLFDVDDGFDAIQYICNGKVLPDNATNGEVMKALFPDSTIEVDGFGWWNLPYQGNK